MEATHPAVLGDIVVVHHLAIGQGCYFQKALKGSEIPDQSLLANFFFQIYLYIGGKLPGRVLCQIVGGEHAIVDGTVDVEVWNFLADQRIHVHGQGSASKGVLDFTLQLPCT